MQHRATTHAGTARSAWRIRAAAAVQVAAAGLVIATGAIHLYLYNHGYSAVPTVGRLFLANFVVAVALGLILLVRPRIVWCLAGATFCIATLGALVISVHGGLFGFHQTLTGSWPTRAVVVEALGAIACTARALLGLQTTTRR